MGKIVCIQGPTQSGKTELIKWLGKGNVLKELKSTGDVEQDTVLLQTIIDEGLESNTEFVVETEGDFSQCQNAMCWNVSKAV